MDATGKRYLRISGGSVAAYTTIVPVSIWMLPGHEHTPWGYGIAFLPIIPSIFAMFGFMRMFRGLDQLQRRIQLEAAAFSFLATCLITLTWASQQNAGLPRFDVSFVAPLLVLLWGLGLYLAKRRYR
jgi:hypothetical protein